MPTSNGVICWGADHPAIDGLHELIQALLDGTPCVRRTIRSEDSPGKAADGKTSLYLRSASAALIPAMLQQKPALNSVSSHLRSLHSADRQWQGLGCVTFERALGEPLYLAQVLAQDFGLPVVAAEAERAEARHAAWHRACARYDHPLVFLEAVRRHDVPPPAVPGQLYGTGTLSPASQWLWSGWAAPERWGSRTLGHRAVIGIPVREDEPEALTLLCRCRDLSDESDLSIIVEGTETPFRVEHGDELSLVTLALPISGRNPGLREVELRQRKISSPLARRISADPRLLGLGLLDLRLERDSIGTPAPGPAAAGQTDRVLLIGCGLSEMSGSLADLMPREAQSPRIIQIELSEGASERRAAACLGAEADFSAIVLYRLGQHTLPGGVFDSDLVGILGGIVGLANHVAGMEATAADLRAVLGMLKTLPAMRDQGIIVEGTAWRARPGAD